MKHRLAVLALVVLASISVYAQQVVRTGPSPEMRAMFDNFAKAFNSGSAETIVATKHSTV